MKDSSPKYVFIFDIDDTLYDIENTFKVAVNTFFDSDIKYTHRLFLDFRKYNNLVYGKALSGEISRKELYIFRAKKAFYDSGLDISEDKALKFQEIYVKSKKNIKIDFYIKDLIVFLKKRNINIALISNGYSDSQYKKLSYLGAGEYFDRDNIFISEDIGVHKPNPKIFEYAIDKLNTKANTQYSKEDIYYIGDSLENDIFGAYRAGIKSIWINHRNNKEESIIKPNYVVHSFKEANNLIKRIIE